MASIVLLLLGLSLNSLPILVSAGQVPVVDGVIGGVRKPSSTKPLEGLVSNIRVSTPTPGALRVTENSGICGGQFLSELLPVEKIH